MVSLGRVLAPFLFLLTTGTAAADERPSFVGQYVTQCPADRQCWLEIADKPRRGVFLAVWMVSHRQDQTDLKCGFGLFMRDTKDGRLIGGLDGAAVEIEATGQGVLTVSGIPAERCGLPLSGNYSAVGY